MTRVLVVDDDAQFRRIVRLALVSHGYEVVEVSDGKSALGSVAVNAPDLVVLDWHLPYMNGVEICQALRAKSSMPIVMTSANRSNSKQAALNAGATDYLPKPFGLNELLRRIEAALER